MPSTMYRSAVEGSSEHNLSKPLNLAFGGWQLGGVLNARTGVPD